MNPPSSRLRVATVSQGHRSLGTADDNRAHIMALAEHAMAYHPDLVCLPEDFVWVSVPQPRPETVPGPTTEAFSELARRHNSYIVCPLQNRRDVNGAERVFNSAVVIGRRGEIVGVYDKRHPVTSSHDYTVMENAVTPGNGEGLFDLDFGRIGIRICFDIGFADEWTRLAQDGARLVVWPSAYDGGDLLSAYALVNGYWVVTSVQSQRSRIIDPCGVTVCQTDKYVEVAVRDINLDFAVCHYDFNTTIPDRILADYAGRVEIRTHADSMSFMVEPVDPKVTTGELMSQYGFEPWSQYYQRHREAHDALRQGKAAHPQPAAHGETRPMWAK